MDFPVVVGIAWNSFRFMNRGVVSGFRGEWRSMGFLLLSVAVLYRENAVFRFGFDIWELGHFEVGL